MRILYFHQYFSTPNLKGPGGIRSYVMAKKLVQKGHDVTLVCGSSGHTGLEGPFSRGRRTGQVEGINIIEINIPYSNYFSLFRRALVFIRFSIISVVIALSEKYDLVFATSTPLTAGIPGIFAKVFRRKKFIFEVRDLWPELPIAMGVVTNPLLILSLKLLESSIYFFSDKIVCLAPGMVQHLKQKGINDCRVRMIPNGCDFNIFDIEKNNNSSEFSLENKKFNAIFSGTHGVANGLDHLLEAAKKIIELEEDQIRIILIGDGQLKPHLVKRCEEENIHNIIFMDSLNKHNLAKLFKEVDVGLQILSNVEAFYYGTSPNKFFDYLSSGLPIICNYPGWISDMVLSSQCGFVASPSMKDDLALKIIEASHSTGKIEEMGINSLKLGKQKFNREVLSEQWAEFILE